MKTTKPARSMRFTKTSTTTGVLTITTGTKVLHTDKYLVEARGSDYGRAFRFSKLSGKDRVGDDYDVCVSGDGRSACPCLGCCKVGTCRHTESARVLVERGLLGSTGYPDDGSEQAQRDAEALGVDHDD